MSYFTHLHVHTDFSLLDGAISLEKLIGFAKKYDLKAIGISDHGNIFGGVKFFQLCKKAGIKPILGMEAYLTEDAAIKSAQNKYYHVLLIVQNAVGYKNLCKLISFSYQKGFYFKPRIDYQILEKHSEGLIVTTACLGGHIPQLLMQGNEQEANTRIDWFQSIFGKDRFYLEIQPEEQEEQRILNQKLYSLSEKTGIPLVVGCDAHYPDLADYQAHEVMLAVQTHAKIDDDDRFSFGNIRAYLKSPQEIESAFGNHKEAIFNTGAIADRCEFAFQTGKLFFPKFEIPQNLTPIDYFKKLCQEGFERLKQENRIAVDQYDVYQKRLDEEIDLISKMGFAEYFLVVSDFIQWAYRNDIPVGPGRGSAAGSLAAWALQITNLDPLKYNLLFERFLNPERISMPDIDVDFCIEGREKVINYVKDKYGHDKVCQIITFGTMMAKGVIKDVARVLGFPFEDSNTISGLIPDQLKITLKDAIEQEPRLKEFIEKNEKTRQLFDIAFRLEGLTRHASKHAAGIVISPEPIDEVLPVYIPPKTDELVTQYAMTELETLGFLKIDFLGLKNLTLIKRALQMIKQNHQIDVDINTIPLDDSATFALLGEGKTTGVFQLESDGLKDVLRKLQPDKFEDIIAVNALYRPGPLGSGMVDDFIERRHGRQAINYLFPELETILKETYGVIVYQEQVMKIASAIAGYTLGQSDILRRAMGKKKAEVMVEQRALFLAGAKKRNFDEQKAGELFDLMAYFAGYGFNKSHSAAYALIAYQTAYLKSHYPAEFLSCLISLETSNPDAMTLYIQEAKSLHLAILKPDINKSDADFKALDKTTILFGLQGIKNVGQAALDLILAERLKSPFVDLLDFCIRLDLRTTNKRIIESLICAGAFDQLPGSRAEKYQELNIIMEQANEYKIARETGQISLFSHAKTIETEKTAAYQFQSHATWTEKETLEREKEVLSIYLSEHPLEIYRSQFSYFNVQSCAELKTQTATATAEFCATACGIIASRRDIVTKKGDRMCFLRIEDATAQAEIVVFPKLFKRIENWLDTFQVFIIKGMVEIGKSNECKIKADEIVPLDLIWQEASFKQVALKLPDQYAEKDIELLKNQCSAGATPLCLSFTDNNKLLMIETKQRISCTQEIAHQWMQQGIHVSITL